MPRQTPYSDYKSLRIEVVDSVLTCVLDPLHRLNLIDAAMHLELEDFFGDLQFDEEISAVILTGAGDVFSCGGDLGSVSRGEFDKGLPGGSFVRGVVRLIRNLVSVPQPVIAALNGDTIGLAASIALHCDVILAVDTARIGDTHVLAGVVAGDGGAIAWPLQVSLSRAKEFLMTGQLLSAVEAERIGLINHVYSAADFDHEVQKFARRLADGPRYAIRWTKMSLNKVLLERINLLLDTTAALEGLSQATHDRREATEAFFQKRPPNFTGA